MNPAHYMTERGDCPRWTLDREGAGFRVTMLRWEFPGGGDPPQCEPVASQWCADLDMASVFIRFNLWTTKPKEKTP